MVTVYDMYATMRDLAAHQTLGRMARTRYPYGWGHSLLSDRNPCEPDLPGACWAWAKSGFLSLETLVKCYKV
jgi:hypothetical protein